MVLRYSEINGTDNSMNGIKSAARVLRNVPKAYQLACECYQRTKCNFEQLRGKNGFVKGLLELNGEPLHSAQFNYGIAVTGAYFSEHAVDMIAYGLFRQLQLIGYLFIS